MISRDTSCRPHELLKLKIKDVLFKNTGEHVYAEVLVNGKTGSRHMPMINSIPYLKDWLDDHPHRGNPNAPLICGFGKSVGHFLSAMSMNYVYRRYQQNYFPKLLGAPTVSPEDKNMIKELLKKPWTLYIRRHTGLTDKSKILPEHVLRQHAGWSDISNMPQRYVHYFGNESSNSILEAYGLKPKAQEINKLNPKPCPNCNEPNRIDSKFCVKCRLE
jgi:integrase